MEDLQRQLQLLTQYNQSLERQIGTYKTEIKSTEQAHEMIGDYQHMKKEYDRVSQQFFQLNFRNSTLTDQISRLKPFQIKTRTLISQCDELQRQIQKIEEINKARQVEIEGLINTNKKLAEEKDQEILRVKKQNTFYEQNNSQLQMKLNQNDAKLTVLKKEKEQSSKNFQSQQKSLEIKLDLSEKRIVELEKTLQDQNDQIQVLKKNYQLYKQQKESLNTQIQDLNRQLLLAQTSEHNQKDSHQEIIRRLEVQIQIMGEKGQILTKQNTKFVKDLDVASNEINKLKNERSELSINLKNKEKQFQQKIGSLDTARNEIESLESRISELSQKLMSKQSQCQQKIEDIALNKREKEKLEDKVTQLSKNIKVKELEYQQRKDELDITKNEVKNLENKISELSKKYKTQSSDYKQKIEDLDIAQKEIQSLQNKVSDLSKSFKTKKSQEQSKMESLQMAKDEVKSLKNKLSELSKTYKTKESEQKQKAEELDIAKDEINSLKNKLLELSKNYKRKESEYKQRIEDLENANQEIKSKDDKLSEQTKKLKAKEQEYRYKFQILEDQIKLLKQNNISALFNKQVSSADDIKSLEETINNQKKYIENQGQKISQIRQAMVSKFNEIQTLQNSNQMLKRQLTASLKNEEIIRKKMVTIKSCASQRSLTGTLSLAKSMAIERKRGKQGQPITYNSQTFQLNSKVIKTEKDQKKKIHFVKSQEENQEKDYPFDPERTISQIQVIQEN